MTRIAALNDWSLGSSEEEDVGPTREALEAQATKYYNEAINYLAHGNDERAHHHFSQVLQNPYVEKASWPEGGQHQRTLPQDVALKYSCLKNLGNLATKRGDYERAAKHYLEAVQLDNTEVTLWQRLGATAIKLRDFELALVAFQEGLNLNANHWPCMDQLMSVLFILEMYMDCLGLAITALKNDPGYVKANAFKDKIFELQPSLIEDAKGFFTNSSVLFQTVDYDKAKGDKFIATCEALRPPPKAPRAASPLPNQRLRPSLQSLTWENLVEALITTYDQLVDTDGMGFAAKIDVYDALKLRDMKTDGTSTPEQDGEAKDESNRSTRDSGREETIKNAEERNVSKKQEQMGSGSSNECKNNESKTQGSEERLEPSVADLSENSLTPRRISGRRHTIELGESQDSFRVGEKRRSSDSDTQQTVDEDMKVGGHGEEAPGKESEGSAPKKLCTDIIRQKEEEGSVFGVNSSAPSGVEEGISKTLESAEGGDAVGDERSECVKDTSPTNPPYSRQESACVSKDVNKDITAVKDNEQTVLPEEKDSEQRIMQVPPAVERENAEKVETKDQSAKETQNESKEETETAIEGNNMAGEELVEKPRENNEDHEPGKGSEMEEINTEKRSEQARDSNEEKSEVQNEPEGREINHEGKETSSNMDSGFKEQENVNAESIVSERTDRGFNQEEEGMHEEPQEEMEMDEEREAEQIEGMMQMDGVGMLGVGTEGAVETVNETEEAVNTLKGIMALQPTEILGLPEPEEFDYSGGYVEYFEGGVYEDEELNMNNDGTYAEGEEEEEVGDGEQEGMEQMVLENEDMNERLEGEKSEGHEERVTGGAEVGNDVEGMRQPEFVEQGVEGRVEQVDEAGDQEMNQEDYERRNDMMEREDEEMRNEMEMEREEEREQEESSPGSSPPKEKEKKDTEPEPSTVRQTRSSTEDESTRNESDNNPEEHEAGGTQKTNNSNTSNTKADTNSQGKNASQTTTTRVSDTQTYVAEEKTGTATTPGAGKKPKRHKRGLERELEQLDYWGRRQERDAKRRRRTISSKLLGNIEEAEYLTWADLLKSFLPSSLLNPNVEERMKTRTTQQPNLSEEKTDENAAVTPSIEKSNDTPPTITLGPSQIKEENNEKKMETEGERTVREEDTHKLTDPNTQGSSGNALEINSKEPKAEDPEKQSDGKGMEEEDVKVDLRKKRKEVILSPLSTEEEQVEAFLLCHEENGGILHLLQLCLITLYKRYLKTWPVLPAKLFTQIYPRVRNHVSHGSPLSLHEDCTRLQEDSMLSLTHWELVLSLYQIAKQDTLHSKLKNPFEESTPHLSDDLIHLTLMLGRGDVWVQEAPQFHTRLRWLQAQARVCQDQPEEAVKYLELLLLDLDRLADPEKEFMVECAKIKDDMTIVNNTEVRRHLNFLQRSHMLEQVVDNYTCNRYQMVAELLTSIFHEPPPKARPGVTLPTRQTQLVILMDSLLKLKDFKGVLLWGSMALAEALKRFNRAEAEEEKARWAKTLMIITDSINTTLINDITLIGSLESEKLVDLANTLIQVLVVQLEKPQSVQVLPLETLTPWILLHRILSHEEQMLRQAEGNQEVAGAAGNNITSQDKPQSTDTSRSPEETEAGEGAEKTQEKESSEEESPNEGKGSEVPYPSTLFLITAHDELGKHSWCCYDDGVFLLYCLDVLLNEVSRPLDSQHKQLLHHTLEQISFCLYSHPSKKSKHKHLRDHGVPQIALCWDRALQLYRYYCPTQLPDFQSSQIPSITDDIASLLKRIVALFPDDTRPENKLSVIDAFINGETKDCSSPALIPPSEEVRDCLYLLGDYHFKNKEWNNAIKNYKIDVVMNPDRLDSWAPLALAMKAIMETQLNSCEVIDNEEEFFIMAQRATRCFRQALKLDEYHTNLWVEFGGLVYMVHSHASRLLKQDLNPDISIETFEMLEKLKGDMLSQAEQCFTKALKIQEEGWDDDCLPDERWLHCYMLGKVAEKMGNDPSVILEYYIKASQHLHQIQAKYPARINYNSPQEYSVEALEMYYRVHAYILKYLQVKEGKSVEKEVVDVFTRVLDEMANSPFVSYQEKKKYLDGRTSDTGNTGTGAWGETGGSCSSQKRLSENSDHDVKTARDGDSQMENIVKEVVGDIISDAVKDSQPKESEQKVDGKDASTGSKAATGQNKQESDDDIEVVEEKVIEKYDHIAIIQRCITALKLCLARFPQNYKALYRLAYYNNTSKFHKDSSRARNYMLGCDFWQRVGYMPVNGLFNERKVWIQQPKNCNFFHGVWRIPNDEVDRPGSFAAHMYRCVSLILDVLPQLKDFYAVLQIALALKNSPEKDKKYLRDNERELLSEHATQVGLQAMKDKYKFLFKGSSPAHNNRRMAFLMDVYRSYKQISRHLPGSEPHLAKMVTEAYASLRGIESDSRANLLREADAFCNRNQHMQHRLPQTPPNTETQINPNRTPFVARRGRPPGTGRGRGRGRGSMYPQPTQPSPNMMAIQEAYKMYENVVNTRAILNNQNLDRSLIYKHQKELEYYQNELSKYMSIPSVVQYFRATLESVGIMAKDKLPPPSVTAAKITPTTPTTPTQSPGNRIPQPTTVSQNTGTQQASTSQAKPLTSLPGRSQIHGVSITSVSAPKTTTSLSTPLKPNMSITVSPVKSSCPPALQGRGEISVISVTRPSVTTKTSTTTTTTKTSTTTTTTVSKGTLPSPSVIKPPTTSPKLTPTPSDNNPRDLSSTVPKLPAGTSIFHPREPPAKPSGPRPQLQAQARPAKTQNTDSALDGLSPSVRKFAADITTTTTTAMSRTTAAPKPIVSTSSPKPKLPKGMTITPAPRIKNQKPLPSPARVAPPSTFAGQFAASINKGTNRPGLGGTSASVSASVIGMEGRRPVPASTSQSRKTGHVAQLSPSQLMQLAFNTRERGGNISGLLNQYSKNVSRQSTSQASPSPTRQQAPAPTQQRPQPNNPQRDLPARPPHPHSKPPQPQQSKPPPPQQGKPDQTQRRSSDDIIVLD